jgi:hypothetical protein
MAKSPHGGAAPRKTKNPSTQLHLPLQEIRDSTIVLRDGTLRSVLMVSSINFALKSDDEQNAIISAYVGFLNGLDHPLQVLVQSRILQIEPYLEDLRGLEDAEQNELMRIQIADYRSFVKELVDLGHIMTKKFFVVVPYDPLSNKKKTFFARVREVLHPANAFRLKDERFLERRKELDMRVRQVAGGLESMGLAVAELDTQSLIELLYSSYNPDTALSQQLGKVTDLRVET